MEDKMQNVTIVGPNLPSQAKAEFHVHATGCTDMTRGWIRRYAKDAWTMDADSRLAVEAEVYDFAADENPDYELGNYQSEFWFAPCVTIPERVEQVASSEDEPITAESVLRVMGVPDRPDLPATYIGDRYGDTEPQ